jgi:IclR helix-turn-helix domain
MGPSTSNDIASRESSPMRSLERALHLLTVMETAGRSMSATELGRAVQLSTPTVLRILSVLDKYGFATKSQGHYRLGVAMLSLAHTFLLGDELTRTALPVLQELAQAQRRPRRSSFGWASSGSKESTPCGISCPSASGCRSTWGWARCWQQRCQRMNCDRCSICWERCSSPPERG